MIAVAKKKTKLFTKAIGEQPFLYSTNPETLLWFSKG